MFHEKLSKTIRNKFLSTKKLKEKFIFSPRTLVSHIENEKFPQLILLTSLSLIVILLPLTLFFLWNISFDTNEKIDHERLGTFGDFFGGVVGAIWSLCGVILFYIALTQQKKDFSTNREALIKQVEALNLQVEEFKLQREELRQSREVFIEQAKTLKQQRLDSTYFSLISLYRETSDRLNQSNELKNYFKHFKSELCNELTQEIEPIKCHQNVKKIFASLIYKRKDELSHYFQIIYRVLKTINDAEISKKEKLQYLKIFRSQLSEYEMIAIYYNSHHEDGKGLYSYIIEYNLLKHLPLTSKIEFNNFITHDGLGILLSRFNNDIIFEIRGILAEVNSNYMNSDFSACKISNYLPMDNNVIFEIYSNDYNYIKIDFNTTDKSKEIMGICLSEFEIYFKFFLYDIFVFSRYIPCNEAIDIKINSAEGLLSFAVTSKRKLSLNSDGEY